MTSLVCGDSDIQRPIVLLIADANAFWPTRKVLAIVVFEEGRDISQYRRAIPHAHPLAAEVRAVPLENAGNDSGRLRSIHDYAAAVDEVFAARSSSASSLSG